MSAKEKPEPSAEEITAKELVRLAKVRGLSLTGPGGLLQQFAKNVFETALNEEMAEHLCHEKNRATEGRDSSNIRDGTFESVIVRKRQRRLGEVDEIVFSLYPRSLTIGELSAYFEQIYGASVSKETVSPATDKAIGEMQSWASRPLNEVYAAIFVDAIVVKVGDGQVANRPIYAVIGVNLAGEKDVLGLWAGTGGEGAKFTDERAH